MKTFYKVMISLCIGIALICAGISLGGLSQLEFGSFFNHFDWRWDAQQIDDMSYQATNQVKEFDISIHSGTIRFIESDVDKVEVKASRIYDGFEIYQTDDRLVIDQAHYWKWFRSYDSSQIDVYVPRGQIIEKSKINASAGSLKVYDLKSQDVSFNVGAGNLKIDNVDCQRMKLGVGMGNATGYNIRIQDQIKINVGMGNAKVDLLGLESEYNYKMKVGLGSARVGDEKSIVLGNSKSYHGTTNKLVDVSVGMGAVKVEMED